jgi:hypothetical protein
MRKGAGSRFRTALQLARTFPVGVLASQVCPYCYNTGSSSPGTRCSYCQRGERERERERKKPRFFTTNLSKTPSNSLLSLTCIWGRSKIPRQ